MPEIESLKQQIETVKAEIARREDELRTPNLVSDAIGAQKNLAVMREVLATLERLLPPF